MLTIEQLIALHRLFAGEPPSPRATVPTEVSISKINHDLGIILPPAFVEFAQRCPSYWRVLFASIGEDFEILDINRSFHTDQLPRVPPWFVVFDRGHDEDCQGFDSRQRRSDGEYPIVYWDASQGLDFDSNTAWRVFHRFHDYLEHMIIHYATTSHKERAEQIIRAA
jgi:hypothetical protein